MQEPTKHQYDFDAATTIAFLLKNGLDRDFKVWAPVKGKDWHAAALCCAALPCHAMPCCYML